MLWPTHIWPLRSAMSWSYHPFCTHNPSLTFKWASNVSPPCILGEKLLMPLLTTIDICLLLESLERAVVLAAVGHCCPLKSQARAVDLVYFSYATCEIFWASRVPFNWRGDTNQGLSLATNSSDLLFIQQYTFDCRQMSLLLGTRYYQPTLPRSNLRQTLIKLLLPQSFLHRIFLFAVFRASWIWTCPLQVNNEESVA